MSMTNNVDQRQNAAQDIKAAINAADDVKAEVNRATNERELFLCSNIGSELARPPGQFTPDRDQYFRIMGELASWCSSGNFTADEMLVLYGEPPRLESIRDIDQEVDIPIYAVMLTPAACKLYVKRNTSENAPRLLRAWFPISETDHPQGAPPPATSPDDEASGNEPPAGPKPRPTPEELDEWMRRNIDDLIKRSSTIEACVSKTGATHREAAAAFMRLPDDKKLRRGKKPPR
jgi:hypothetical protein